jgi:hypothetical protein
MDAAGLRTFGAKYTAAWCSQEAATVAAFYAESGSLKINEGTPSVGRTAITAAAQGFKTEASFKSASRSASGRSPTP